MGGSLRVKTTLEIPDATFRKAKSEAAAKGVPFREFVTQAVDEKLRQRKPRTGRQAECMHLAGAFAKTLAQRRETRRIQEVIDREFEIKD